MTRKRYIISCEGFYPSPESIEKEIESAGSRVKMYVMSIDHMTGKLVHEK